MLGLRSLRGGGSSQIDMNKMVSSLLSYFHSRTQDLRVIHYIVKVLFS
jgi:hypothetical protein